MPVESLPIFCSYDKQRFEQFGAMDCANWYQVGSQTGKKKRAMYPAMGRAHVESLGENKLIFDGEPSQVWHTIDFFYAIVGTQVIQVDQYYQEKVIGSVPLGSTTWFAFLEVGTAVYAILTAETKMYIIAETGAAVTYQEVTDASAPTSPQYVAAFGNRFVVSQKDTPDYYLSQLNAGGAGDPTTLFTISGAALVNRASGRVRQFGVLHNQLYIFTDFSVDPWSNIPSQFTVAGAQTEFPWKLNSSYNFNYGIRDPKSLDVDFGKMVWLAQNRSGQISFMVSTGQMPQEITTEAVDVLLSDSTSDFSDPTFLKGNTNGFLYEYENTTFYRVSAGTYDSNQILDQTNDANCIEYNFATNTWSRCIEVNGERNRITKHIFFKDNHLVTVQGDPAMYRMAGNIYRNELRNADVDRQADNAFLKFPMRYTLVTEHIFMEDYAEFITDYVEIDFVFGNRTFYKNATAFGDTIFIIAEDSDDDDCPIYIISEDADAGSQPIFHIIEGTNTPQFDDNHYNTLFKPHLELYWSDDGGVSFHSADVREFSRLGQYRYRMRWYEMGASRNRCYALVAVSSAPIVILGGTHNIRRASGGAN